MGIFVWLSPSARNDKVTLVQHDVGLKKWDQRGKNSQPAIGQGAARDLGGSMKLFKQKRKTSPWADTLRQRVLRSDTV